MSRSTILPDDPPELLDEPIFSFRLSVHPGRRRVYFGESMISAYTGRIAHVIPVRRGGILGGRLSLVNRVR